MTVPLLDRPDTFRLVENGDFSPAQHPRGPDGRFTHSFAALMSSGEKSRARRAATAFAPKRGINTTDGARTYLAGVGQPSPAAGVYFAGGHRQVNQALRAGDDSHAGIKAMDAAMVDLPDDVLVSRRVPAHMLGDAAPEQLVGFKVADAGYTAASVADLPSGPGDVTMRIAVPAGTRAAIHPDSGAIVLDRGLELAVLHVQPNEHGGKDMFLTVLRKGDGGSSSAAPASNAPVGGEDTGTPRRDATLRQATAGASEEPASLGSASPELRDTLHGAFDFSSGGLSASLDDQVSNVYKDGDGRTVIRAEGYIRNDQGRIVGSFRRMLYPDTGEVHNDTLALSGSEQGSGFAQQFAARSEPQLADLGMTYATVSATGVGGYAWRRYGWDPDSVNAKGDVPDRLRDIAEKYDLSDQDQKTLTGWLAAFQQGDQSKWPTPSEIGDFGKGSYDRKDDAGRAIWPGKDALVGSSWQGRRDLNTGRAGT